MAYTSGMTFLERINRVQALVCDGHSICMPEKYADNTESTEKSTSELYRNSKINRSVRPTVKHMRGILAALWPTVQANQDSSSLFPPLITSQLESIRLSILPHISAAKAAQINKVITDLDSHGGFLLNYGTSSSQCIRSIKNLVQTLIQQYSLDGIAAYNILIYHAQREWPVESKLNPYSEILREIYFVAENRQAGIGILHYFSVILQQKYPGIDASVSIQQGRDRITMIIRHPDGRKDEIEKLFSDYGMVLSGELPPDSLLSDPIQLQGLKQKLEITSLELRQTKELLSIEKRYSDSKLQTLEADVKFLRESLASQMVGYQNLSSAMIEQISIISDNNQNDITLRLVDKLLNAINNKDETDFRLQIKNINDQDPTLLDKLQVFLMTNTFGGVIGNTAYDWLKMIWPILPK